MSRDFNKKTNNSWRRGNKVQSTRSKRKASLCRKSLNRKVKLFYFLPFFLIVILGLLQIYFSNKLATQGRNLKKYDQEILLVEGENKSLKSEIASLGGLIKLSLIAEEKGFIKNAIIINLSNKTPVALKSL